MSCYTDFEGHQTCLMPGAKWLVTHFVYQAKQVIQKYGDQGIRMNGWDSFTILYNKKMPRIEINNEVSNDWKSCKKRAPGHPVSNYYILDFGHLLTSVKVLSHPLICQSTHFCIAMPISLNHLFRWVFKVCDKHPFLIKLNYYMDNVCIYIYICVCIPTTNNWIIPFLWWWQLL